MNIREKLITILRELEKEKDPYRNTYHYYLEKAEQKIEAEEILNFPNFRTVEERFEEEYSSDDEIIMPVSAGSIRAELKRMESDGLVMIGTQQIRSIDGVHGDYDKESESIILTTKGKSKNKYFWHKAWDNPVTTVLSVLALIISIISLAL